MNFDTQLLHGVDSLDIHTGASSFPKYQASTFHQTSLFEPQEFTYTRFGNPTVTALEKAIACLEKASYGLAFSSGMAAISSLFLSLKSESHIIAPRDIYGGAYQVLHDILPDLGMTCTFLDAMTYETIKKSIRYNTNLIYIETPSNPLLKVTNIRDVVRIAKEQNIVTALDNTFMTPIGQSPISLGVDVVIHSATKFINGHSDVIAGLIATSDEELFKKIRKIQISFGSILGPEDAWLVLRGLKTLDLRFTKSVSNARKIAEYLFNHAKVKSVYYPGISSHENYEIHNEQASSGGAVISFDLGSKEKVEIFSNQITLPISAVSLGGVETILSYPRTMSHACMSEEDRLELGVTEGLLRLSIGIEDCNDLINDFDRALNNV